MSHASFCASLCLSVFLCRRARLPSSLSLFGGGMPHVQCVWVLSGGVSVGVAWWSECVCYIVSVGVAWRSVCGSCMVD